MSLESVQKLLLLLLLLLLLKYMLIKYYICFLYNILKNLFYYIMIEKLYPNRVENEILYNPMIGLTLELL